MVINKKLTIVDDERIPIFTEMAQQLKRILTRYFADVVIKKGFSGDEDVCFILNPHHPHKVQKGKGLYVGWDLTNAESITDYQNRNFGQLDILAVDNWEKQFMLPNYQVQHLPFSSDMVEAPQNMTKDTDIAVIGDRNSTRMEVIQQCEKKGHSVFATTRPIYGIERDTIYARSKIVLDIPRRSDHLFLPSVREQMAVKNHCLIVSSGKYLSRDPHIVWAASDQVAEVVKHFLLDSRRQPYIELGLKKFERQQTAEKLSRIISDYFTISHG